MQNPPWITPDDEQETYLPSPDWIEAAIRRFASGAGITLFGRVFGRAFLAFSQIIFARYLGPEEFGLFAIVWTMLQMGSTIAPLGVDKGIIRYATHYWKTDVARLKGVIFQSIGISILAGLGMGVLLYLSAEFISVEIFKNAAMTPVIHGFAPMFALLTTIKVTAATSRVTQRMRYSVIIEDLLPSIATLTAFIPIYLLDYGLSGVIGSAAFGYLLSFVYGFLVIKQLFPEIFTRKLRAVSLLKELMTFSLPSWLAGAFSMFIIWINRLLVGVYRPEAEVGIFQACSQISLLFPIILSAINSVFSPMIADLYQKERNAELRELFIISTKWCVYLSLPLAILTVTIPQDLLQFLFGDGYETGSLALVVLSIGQIVNISTGSVGWMMMMTGNQTKWFWNTTIMLLSSVVMNIILTPHFGMVGAAAATSIGISVLYIIGLIQVRSILGYWPYDKRFRKVGFIAIVSLSLAIASLTFNISHSLSRVTLVLFVVLISITLILFTIGLDSEDREILRFIRQRLERKK
jgi:O-antigen/teichoic acid export membrane protein